MPMLDNFMWKAILFIDRVLLERLPGSAPNSTLAGGLENVWLIVYSVENEWL